MIMIVYNRHKFDDPGYPNPHLSSDVIDVRPLRSVLSNKIKILNKETTWNECSYLEIKNSRTYSEIKK